MVKGTKVSFKKKAVKASKRKSSFAKRVFSVLNKQRELKVSAPNTVAVTDVREAITSASVSTNTLPLLPLIPQGTAEQQRIGNVINLKKLVIRGYYRLQLPVGSAANTRILLRSMILKQKSQNDAFQITNGAAFAQYNQLLEPANSYLGAIADYNTPINTNCFTLKKQWRKIMTCEYDGIATNALGMNESYFFFNYTMKFGQGKRLEYITSGTSTPANFGYFLAHSATILGSGSALPVGLVGCNYTSTAYFYDD